MTAPHVLVVDDTADGKDIARAFEQAGWNISLCSVAVAAIDTARQEPIDGAVITFRLAEDRGDAIFYRVAALRPELRERVVFLTLSDVDARIAGVTGCPWLRKPVDPEAVVGEVLRLARARDAPEVTEAQEQASRG